MIEVQKFVQFSVQTVALPKLNHMDSKIILLQNIGLDYKFTGKQRGYKHLQDKHLFNWC